jgi:hypothetical protein
MGLVGQDGDVHLTETALFSWGVDPGQVRELGVSAGSNDLATDSPELFGAIRITDNLSWAHKSTLNKTCFYFEATYWHLDWSVLTSQEDRRRGLGIFPCNPIEKPP